MARAAAAVAVGAAALGMAPSALAAPAATLTVKTFDIVKGSTYTAGSFALKNESTDNERITSFSIDLREGPALFWDFAFDPDDDGDDIPAGDTVRKGYEPNGGTGGVVSKERRYTVAEGGGWAVLSVDTEGFDAGDELKFSIDIDPTSVQGTPGLPSPHQASVSGAELHGATVTVSFSNGTVLKNDISTVLGSSTAGAAKLRHGTAAAPLLARAAGPSPAVVADPAQTVVVAGPPSASGVVLVADGQLIVSDAPNGGFELDPFEANMAVKFTEVPFTLGADGVAVVPLTLTDTEPLIDPKTSAPFAPLRRGLNYVTAYLITDGAAGAVSDPLVLHLDPDHVPEGDPPGVTELTPPDGASGVAVATNVTAVFDEPMDAETLRNGGLALVDEAGAPVAATVSGDAAATRFTLDPVADLAPGGRYTARIGATAADVAGNRLPGEVTWSFTTARETTRGPDGPKPPDDPRDPWCATVPERPERDSKGGVIRLEASQLLISQRIAQAAVRRANAIERWLAEGLVADDLCGSALGAAEFAPGVTLAPGASVAPVTVADPRPIRVQAPRRRGPAGRVALDAGQLLINQRISQAAVRRVNALIERLDGGLTGGDIRDGAITGAKLMRGLVVQSAADGAPVPPSRTRAGVRSGGGGKVTVSVRQLQINQRISQAAVRRVNALADRLMRGLTGRDFRDGTITAAKLAPELHGAPPA